MMDGYGVMNGYGWTAGMGWFGFLVMALFWIGVILLIMWSIRVLGATPQRTGSDALGIVQQRFARGEISSAEYEQARATLR